LRALLCDAAPSGAVDRLRATTRAPGSSTRERARADKDDQGDLVFKTDFRSVYAGVLKGWLGADPAAIVGKAFSPLELVKG